jgi:hypothetical protein
MSAPSKTIPYNWLYSFISVLFQHIKEFIYLKQVKLDMVEVSKIRIFLSILLIGLIAVSTANADDLSITVKTLQGTARPGDTLSYEITFYNFNDEPTYISTNLLSLRDVNYLPDGVNAFTIPANDFYKMTLNAQVSQTDANNYGSKTGKTTYHQIMIFDKNGTNLGYTVTVPATIINPNTEPIWSGVSYSNLYTVPAKVDPRQPFSVKFNVNNPIKDVTVNVVAKSSDFQLSPSAVVVPKGANDVEVFGLSLPVGTVPGTYDFTLDLMFPDDTMTVPVVIDVLSYSDCVIVEKTQTNIFGKTYTAAISVQGNEAKTCTVSTMLFGLERNLAGSVADGYQYQAKNVVWQFSVQPGTEKQVGYSISYLPLILLPFVILVIVGGFWYMTRKVEIVKELVDYRRHPGFMDLKIQLKVKNLSDDEMKDVRVIEPLPVFVKDIRDFGTVPGEISKYHGHKAVEWKLEHLKPKEERIFSYKLRTSIEVLGKMNFLATVIHYTDVNGKKQEESSNGLTVEVE